MIEWLVVLGVVTALTVATSRALRARFGRPCLGACVLLGASASGLLFVLLAQGLEPRWEAEGVRFLDQRLMGLSVFRLRLVTQVVLYVAPLVALAIGAIQLGRSRPTGLPLVSGAAACAFLFTLMTVVRGWRFP